MNYVTLPDFLSQAESMINNVLSVCNDSLKNEE